MHRNAGRSPAAARDDDPKRPDEPTTTTSSATATNPENPATEPISDARPVVDDSPVGQSSDSAKTSDSDSASSSGESDADDEPPKLVELMQIFKLSGGFSPAVQRRMLWIHRQIQSGVRARDCFERIFQPPIGQSAEDSPPPPNALPASFDQLHDNRLWRILAALVAEPVRRQPLPAVRSLQHVVQLLRTARRILVLTGAGVSVSCGIPDFRSPNGLYARLRRDYPELSDPQCMFDVRHFHRDARPFFRFAREIYPGAVRPSPVHRFVRALERTGRLLRNYTQNIDTLERQAGIRRLVECHGSLATASCTRCGRQVAADVVRPVLLDGCVPVCARCRPHNAAPVVWGARPDGPDDCRRLVDGGVLRPDIVFFGESLPAEFHAHIERDRADCDAVLVIGSSLKVCPVALIPGAVPNAVPQVLINRERLDAFAFDVELLGDADVVVNQLCHMLAGEFGALGAQSPLTECAELPPDADGTRSLAARLPPATFHRLAGHDGRRYVFPGADVRPTADERRPPTDDDPAQLERLANRAVARIDAECAASDADPDGASAEKRTRFN